MDYTMMPEVDDFRGSEDSGEEPFSFHSVTGLRKNLNETFEKQVTSTTVSSSSGKMSVSSTSSSVTNRIAQFEAAAMAAKPPLPTKLHSGNAVPANRLAVYLRIRPPVDSQKDSMNTIEVLKPERPGMQPTTVRTYPPEDSNATKINIHREHHDASSCAKEFTFHQVLEHSTTQAAVYTTVADPMIQSLWDATVSKSSNSSDPESALLFSYGITNAGKTHTILGDIKSKNQAQWGIIPRAISDIFGRMQKIPKVSASHYDMYVSYFEIYNEQIYDLVPHKNQTANFGMPSTLKVRERGGQTVVRGLAKHKIRDIQHGIELTLQANSKRHTSSNNINVGSSRSHCICQVQLVKRTSHLALAQRVKNESVSSLNGYSTDEEVAMMKSKSSTLWIVDLAGSERSKRTGMAGGARQKEASQINKSLMTLMRCLSVMRESGRHSSTNVVPYRESKLSHVFMSHLAGHSASRTAMIVNVNPAFSDFDEIQHVLGYAAQAKMIQMNPEELNKKRKLYFGNEYGMDGRKKVRANTAGAASKMALKVVKQLSPKKLAKKLFRSKPTIDEMPLGSMMSNSAHPSSTIGQPALKRMRPGLSTEVSLSRDQEKSDKELVETKAKLKLAHTEIELLRAENDSLKDVISTQESQIRMEVSGEMEELLRATRERNKEELERLRTQASMHPLGSRSTRKAQMDRAEVQVQELQDKVDECEEEMVRMHQDHEEALAKMKSDHADALRELQVQIDKKVRFKHDINSNKLVADLERELAASRTLNERLEKSKVELVENYEKLLKEAEEDDEQDVCDDSSSDEKEVPLWKQKLLRQRRSAKANAGGKSPLRRPLGQIDTNTPIKLGTEKGGKQQWIFPKNPSSKDSDGTYRRPLGRAPAGREWDAAVGAWKLGAV